MLDRFEREIKYLRISVTDRCNLACDYCTGGKRIRHVRGTDILTFEEITRIVRTGASLGISKIRLTGGEPLLRKEISKLVEMLAAVDGITDLSLSTNGILLARHALELKRAGLHRVNVSIDTLDPVRYAEITGCRKLRRVLRGIEAAEKHGLVPVKLNCVIDSSPDEYDAETVAGYALKHGYTLRYIRRMSLEKGTFGIVHGGTGGDCTVCDRLRLTCDGRIIPCLFSDLSFSVRELGAEEAFRSAILCKPLHGKTSTTNNFQVVGG
jgi:cyclic pyranopterin phosphate synthase